MIAWAAHERTGAKVAKRNEIAAKVKAEIEERARAVEELRTSKLMEIRDQLVLAIQSGSRKPLDAATRLLDQLLHQGPAAETTKSEDNDAPE